MSVKTRIRDGLKGIPDKGIAPIVTWWLSDRPDPGKGPGLPSSLNVGFRFLWSCAAIWDCAMEFIYQGVQAAWPGVGTATALPYVGRTRGIVMGVTESPPHYAARLVLWLETWAGARTLGLAQQLHQYMGDNPMVRIIERRSASSTSQWTTVASDGTVTYANSAWNWDATSDPGSSANWSHMWIVIYTDATYYPARPGVLGNLLADSFGIGIMQPQTVTAQLKKIIADWKGAHSRVKAVLFCSDPTRYDPANPGSGLPNGNWGHWSKIVAGASVPSDRDVSVTRYMEPN